MACWKRLKNHFNANLVTFIFVYIENHRKIKLQLPLLYSKI